MQKLNRHKSAALLFFLILAVFFLLHATHERENALDTALAGTTAQGRVLSQLQKLNPEELQKLMEQKEKERKRKIEEFIEKKRAEYFSKHKTKPVIKEMLATSAIPGRISVDGKSMFLFGVNYPFFNGLRGLDIGPLGRGRDISPQYVMLPPLKSGESGFDPAGIDAQFSDLASAGVKVVRWAWGFDGRGFFDFDKNMFCQGLFPLTRQNLSKALEIANKHNIRIWAVLLDFRFVSSAFFKPESRRVPLYADGTFEEPHADVIRNAAKRKALIQNGFHELAAFLKGKKEIFCLEIMNEASNVTQGKDPVTGYELVHKAYLDTEEARVFEKYRIDLALMQQFMNEAYDAIKKADPERLVLSSSLNNVTYLPGFVGRAKSDFYSAHYNADGWTDYGKVHTVDQIQQGLGKWGLKLDKPLVMGEAPSALNRNMDYFLEAAYKGGWAGFLPWSWCEMIGVFERYYAEAPRVPEPAPPEIEFFRNWASKNAAEIDF